MKENLRFVLALLALSIAIVLWMPRSHPKPCSGVVETVFGNCVR
jgi:hypothetical protein